MKSAQVLLCLVYLDIWYSLYVNVGIHVLLRSLAKLHVFAKSLGKKVSSYKKKHILVLNVCAQY